MAGNFDSIKETKSEEDDFSFLLIFLFVLLFIFFYPIILAFNEFKKKNDGQDVIFWDIYSDYAFNDGGIYQPSGRFSSPFSSSG